MKPTRESGQHPARAVLVSTYELGHQPFGLASPAAWLARAGIEVRCVDLAVDDLDETAVDGADLVAFYLPMHTATRLAVPVIRKLRKRNEQAHFCAYGIYAPVNAEFLGSLGVQTVIGGEFEGPLVELARTVPSGRDAVPARLPIVSTARQDFILPARGGLPALERYATLRLPDGRSRVTAYVEATRGCKHRCRHCPVVPVYEGRFRVVQHDVVLEDIAQQVAAGAEHVTFGDPDFLNGPGHAVRLVRALHERFPDLTYDVTIKIEHLVRHADLVPVLRSTGCVLVTSAVEAFDDVTLEAFAKRHTREDFTAAVALLEAEGLALNPTFVAFTPWTTPPVYVDLLATVAAHGLVPNVAPVQYAIRLLVPEGSHLLELPDVRSVLDGFDAEGLCHRWSHPDPRIDELQLAVFAAVERGVASGAERHEVFRTVCEVTAEFVPESRQRLLEAAAAGARGRPVPHLSEPWFCCAEPVTTQLEPSL